MSQYLHYLFFSVVDAYMNMYDPKIDVVDANKSVEEVITDIKKRIGHLL